MTPRPEELVDAIQDIGGRHPGFRAAHAKGTLASGSFTATPAAAGLTRAAHMQGDVVRVTVRFSNGSGKPTASDATKDGRGFAAKFYLPDGATTDIVGLTLPQFFARTPDDFLEFTRARKPDPETGRPDMDKLGRWLGAHPEAQAAIQFALTENPPESYLTCTYNSIHAYRWIDADGGERFVRYRWTPEAGESHISEEDAERRERDYLQQDLAERLESGDLPGFRLSVVIATDADDPNDPTVAWPEEREWVEVGRLELTGPETEREQGDDVLVFDPTRVTDGIECSDDQILHARPGAYSVSVARRTGSE